MHFSRRPTIIQVAIDSSNSATRLSYQLETLASLLCFSYVHCLDSEIRVDIYSNKYEFWEEKALPLLEQIAPNLSARVFDSTPEANLFMSQPFLLKCKLITKAFTSAQRDDAELAIYMDGDITAVKPWLADIHALYENSQFHLALAHECGLTSLLPYPNYNSGFIVASLNQAVLAFMHEWSKLTEIMAKNRSPVLDQDSMVHVLGRQNPDIVTLPSVYNLRCHEVYGYGADVWSPVFNIHSHISSKVFVWILRLWLVGGFSPLCVQGMIAAGINALDSHLNVAEFPHKPRRVTMSPSDSIELYLQGILRIFPHARYL